jgi:hypothetical protein
MNIDGPDLEDRYRQVLRLLPGYYRGQWEEDMVAALLDSRMTGDKDDDEYTFEFGRPAWPEVASVAALAARLYLGGAGTPRRYFAWGQAVRGAVLAGGCPAGFTKLSAPGQNPACYRPLGAPVTITSAAVSPGPTVTAATSPPNAPPSAYGLLIVLPAADRAELAAVTTQAYDAQGAVDISVVGKTWAQPMTQAPVTHGPLTMMLPSRNEFLQLQRILAAAG